MGTIRLVRKHGYRTSRDYALLADLMQKVACICFVDHCWGDGEVTRDIAATIYCQGKFSISCRGTSYLYSLDREMFIQHCHECNVEFIVPAACARGEK